MREQTSHRVEKMSVLGQVYQTQTKSDRREQPFAAMQVTDPQNNEADSYA